MNESPRHAETPEHLPWLTPQVRAWIYGVITALVPILTIYGIVDQTTAPLWLSLAASVLATSTAFAHTPRGEG